jgi:hypothetical protein
MGCELRTPESSQSHHSSAISPRPYRRSLVPHKQLWVDCTSESIQNCNLPAVSQVTEAGLQVSEPGSQAEMTSRANAAGM